MREKREGRPMPEKPHHSGILNFKSSFQILLIVGGVIQVFTEVQTSRYLRRDPFDSIGGFGGSVPAFCALGSCDYTWKMPFLMAYIASPTRVRTARRSKRVSR